MKDAETVPLGYETRGKGGVDPLWLAQIALVTVSIPLVMGLGSTVAYLLSRADIFAVLGLIALGIGPFSVLGTIVLGVLALYQNRRRHEPDKRVKRYVIVAITAGILSFPAAVGCFVAGSWAMSRVAVHVTNTGDTHVENVRLDLAGKTLSVGDLQPCESWEGGFHPDSGRSLVRWSSNGQDYEHLYSHYTDGDSFWGSVDIQLNGDEAKWN